MSISKMAKDSKVVFAGTVATVRAEWAPRRTTIVTKVSFEKVIVVKGHVPRGKVVITIEGGQVGNRRYMETDQPQFEVGERYIVLCYSEDLGSPRNGYIPIIGLYQGLFRVRPDPRTGHAVVWDAMGRPIVAIANGRVVVVAPPVQAGAESLVTGTVKDVPFVVDRVRPARWDTLERRARPQPIARARPVASVEPAAGPRLQRPDSSYRPDWVPNSVHLVYTGEPTESTLAATADPGTRMPEDEFIAALKKLMTE